jgi:DDE superfamily endonuclease
MQMLPDSLASCLLLFESCFRAPSYRRFVTLMTGWLLCVGQHTVTGVMRAAGVAARDHSGYHRFFNRGVWSPQRVGLAVLSMVLKLVAPGERVRLTLDDTLARHTGKRIAGAGMHHDPLLSTGTKPAFHFGHNWVVLAVAVTLPWRKTYSLPFWASMCRTVKTAKKEAVAHRKKTELASAMLKALGRHLPNRHFLLFADNAYVNREVLRELPENIHLVGRGRMDAAVYATPEKPRGRGRPPVRGKRLLSPSEQAARGRWRKLPVTVYGKQTVVRVKVFDARWYRVARGRTMRFVVVRDWPGHKKDDVLVSTDLTLGPVQIIEGYCFRWSIEETYGWVKSRLGLEHPRNRTPRAVARTAPMALWAYSIVVCWYAQWSARRATLPVRFAPWYASKAMPSFADMLATLRRECWAIWISDQADRGRFDQKSLAPLLDVAGYG